MVVIRNSLGEVFQDSEEQMLKTYILRLFPKGIVTLSSQWKYFVTFGTIILIVLIKYEHQYLISFKKNKSLLSRDF